MRLIQEAICTCQFVYPTPCSLGYPVWRANVPSPGGDLYMPVHLPHSILIGYPVWRANVPSLGGELYMSVHLPHSTVQLPSLMTL